eukprot:scpid54116/ scgid7189/ Sodium/hydrogen exchanger 9; Na(+)/H(+) exchanger 9; Solute carrier family 9 member 9
MGRILVLLLLVAVMIVDTARGIEESALKKSLEYEGDNAREVEEIHKRNSLSLLLMVFLLILIVLTIWLFKVKNFRILHETGFSLIYGILVGVIVKYSSSGEPVVTQTCGEPPHNESAPTKLFLEYSNNTYRYSLSERLFTDRSGGTYESTLLFDPETFFFVLLPPIIFYAGYDMRRKYFFRNIGAILIYAFAGTTISCFVIGLMMYGYTKTGWEVLPIGTDNLVECLLFGALISATDPVTVLAIFHDLHVDVDLFAMVFGESVMNDAVAIVLFRSISEYSPTNDSTFEVAAVFKSIGIFIGVFVGSFAIGVVIGLICALFTKLTKIKEYPLMESGFFALVSYAAYLIAEAADLTGIVAVLFCGITQAHYTYFNLSPESRTRTKEFFELLNFLAENFVFVYMGLALFSFRYHQWNYGFILFSFLAITLGRIVNVIPLSFVANLKRRTKIPRKFQAMMIFAGLRGAIAFALAIRNTGSEVRQLFLTTTLVIVFITVFVNGGTTQIALQYLKIDIHVTPEQDRDILELEKPDSEQQRSDLYQMPSRTGRHAPTGVIRAWTGMDRRFVRPIFTSRGPPLTEIFPHRLHWLARLLTAPKPTSTTSDDDHVATSYMNEGAEDLDMQSLTGPAQLSFHDDDSNLDADLGGGNQEEELMITTEASA